jgi:hypothetical protein
MNQRPTWSVRTPTAGTQLVWCFVYSVAIASLPACEESTSIHPERQRDTAALLDQSVSLDLTLASDAAVIQNPRDEDYLAPDSGSADTTPPSSADTQVTPPAVADADTAMQLMPDATRDAGTEDGYLGVDGVVADAMPTKGSNDAGYQSPQDMAGDTLQTPSDAAIHQDVAIDCPDDDDDGITVCQGDCADDDPLRRPAQFEWCDGMDQDCDGLVDERCVGGRRAISWTRVLSAPGVEEPFCSQWTSPNDADVRCDSSGIHLGPIALRDWFALRQRGQPIIAGQQAHASTQFDPLDDFRVTIRIRILSLDEPGRLLDGQVFGYLGLGFENEVPAPGFPGNMTGVAFFPTQLPRFYYQGGPSSGGGYTGVAFDHPLTIQIERVGHELTSYINGRYTQHIMVPGRESTTNEDHPHHALRHVFVACVHCRAVVETVLVERPENQIQEADRVPCQNILRNAAFEHRTEKVPDFWAIQVSDVLAGDCCRAPTAAEWRRSLASIGADHERPGVRLDVAEDGTVAPTLVQPVTLPSQNNPLSLNVHTHVDGDARLRVGLPGCVPEEQVLLLTPAVSRHDLAFDCSLVDTTQVQFTHLSGERISLLAAQLSPGPVPDEICQDWRDTHELVVLGQPSNTLMDVPGHAALPDGLALHLDHEEDVFVIELVGQHEESRIYLDPHGGDDEYATLEYSRLGLIPSVGQGIQCLPPACPLPTLIWRIPFQAFNLDATVTHTWAMGLTTVQNQMQSNGRLHLYWQEEPWRDRLAPAAEYAPVDMASWAVAIKNWVLHPRKVDQNREHSLNAGHFALFRGLGLDGIGLVNPHPNEIQAFVANAGLAPQLDLDLQTFFSIPFWRDDEQRQTLFRWADSIAQSIEACSPNCPPVHWNILDEPSQAELQACRRDLSTNADRINLRPELLALLGPLGCIGAEPCESSIALLACRGAFPALLTALVTDLAARIPVHVTVGINVTRDAGLRLIPELGDVFDHVSYTNNWVGRDVPQEWSLVPLTRFRDQAGSLPYVGYNLIGGALGGWQVRSGPTARAYRGMSLLQVARGALSLRSFVWPPHSTALLDELGEQARLFAALAPTVPRGRLQPHPPTSSPRLVATVFRDEQRTVLIVVNTARENIYGGIDLRGLMGDGNIPEGGLGQGVMRGEALWDRWAPFEGHVYQLN